MRKVYYILASIFSLGILFIILLNYSFERGHDLSVKYAPLVNATIDIKYETTIAHLWLEEILSGDKNEKIVVVKKHIENAKWYINAMLNGGENYEGEFIALTDPKLRENIKELSNSLDIYEKLTLQRYSMYHDAKAGTYLDQKFDEHFDALIDAADIIELGIQEIIRNELKKYKKLEIILISITLVSLFFILWFVYINEKNILRIDRQLMQQARSAQMGEMIGNIAHQWRQPLNTIGLIIQKLKFYNDNNFLDDKKLNSSVEKSMDIVNGMSKTIDDFRNFFAPNKEKELFSLYDLFKDTYAIVEDTFEENLIDFKIEMFEKDLKIEGYRNELSQVILNLISNSKDALIEKESTSSFFKITAKKVSKSIFITCCDNGGGIDNDILDKVFNPYFTTKDEGKGTGIGLYMSKEIIEKHMDGKINIFNTDVGVCFSIELASA